MSDLPEWPEEPDADSSHWREYERARADAAIERLRVAVEALHFTLAREYNIDITIAIKKALAAIGEVP